jgi:hypothetical protein
MRKRLLVGATGAALGSAIAVWAPWASSAPSGYEPVLDPSRFTTTIDNPYFPLPVGRTLVYRGVKDGQTLLEKTSDWYAQDNQGNVWYLGEDTFAYLPNGKVDTSGSWEAGVHDAEPGIVMESSPQIPDAHRQEFLSGQAEDTAWIVNTSGSATVPNGTFKNVLTSLEATRIEPGAYDRKLYAPGVGMIREEALTGGAELAELVSISG